MFSDKIQQLTAAKAKVAALEKSLASELHKELAGLPVRYGFASANTFIDAVKAASGKRLGRKPGRPKAANGSGVKRRKRAKITDETRADVKKLTAAGKTGKEIAQALKISLPSVQNIRKALGLVKPRKK